MPRNERDDTYSSRKYGGRGRGDVKVRQLRANEAKATFELSDIALAYFSAFGELTAREGLGTYISAPTTAGTRKIRCYLPDEAVETYLSIGEEPAEVFGELMESVLGAQLERELHELAGDRLAQRPQEPPKRARGTRSTPKTPPVETEASEGP